MKKLLFITLLLFTFNINAQAQGADNDLPTISETERIVDKYGEKLAQGFSSFMESATPVAQEGFKIVVYLQLAKGVSYLLPLIFFILSVILFKNEYNRIENILKSDNVPNFYNGNYGPFDESNINIKIIIYLIITIVSAIIAVITTTDGLTHLIAPEWFAIKEISTLF